MNRARLFHFLMVRLLPLLVLGLLYVLARPPVKPGASLQ